MNRHSTEILLASTVSAIVCTTFFWYTLRESGENELGPIEYHHMSHRFRERDPQLWESIRTVSITSASLEPSLRSMLDSAIISHDSLESSIAHILSNKLADGVISVPSWKELFEDVLLTCPVEGKYDLPSLMRADLSAVIERDPACLDGAHALLFFKGFQCLQAHRVAHVLWKRNRKHLALAIQARCSEVFGMDIHPACVIGKGVMFDHGTGVVIGETATIGNECSILHGVTLGGTGKRGGKLRHPQVGNEVLIGAGASILGNVSIGNQARIGCGSVVMVNVPDDSTAVGIPAKIAKKYPSELSGL